MLVSITDEQCLRFRHKSKAFYTTALKLEVMKTAVVPTAHCGTAPTILAISLYVLPCYQLRPVPHGSARRAVSNKSTTASVEEHKSSNKSGIIAYSPGIINSDDYRTGQSVAPSTLASVESLLESAYEMKVGYRLTTSNNYC